MQKFLILLGMSFMRRWVLSTKSNDQLITLLDRYLPHALSLALVQALDPKTIPWELLPFAWAPLEASPPPTPGLTE